MIKITHLFQCDVQVLKRANVWWDRVTKVTAKEKSNSNETCTSKWYGDKNETIPARITTHSKGKLVREGKQTNISTIKGTGTKRIFAI